MPAKTAKPQSVWKFGEDLGLRLDGGWVDALKQKLESSNAKARSGWEELLRHARAARPRVSGDWGELAMTVTNLCGYPDWNPANEPDFDPDEPPLVDDPDLPAEEPHPEPGTDAYDAVLARCSPDEKWLEEAQEIGDRLGKREFVQGLAQLYRAGMQSGIGSLNRKTPNRDILDGLLWTAVAAPEVAVTTALNQFAIWSLAHNTAQAKTIGIVLTSMKSEHAAGALRIVELGAKRQSARERFARFASHVEKRVGITPEISAERYVPTLGLNVQGKLRSEFPGIGAIELAIEGTKGVMRIFNATGKQVASAPAVMKREHGEDVKEFRETAKGCCKMLLNQRDRLENLLLEPRWWKFSSFEELYLTHPIVGSLARRLIWTLDGLPVVFREHKPVDVKGKAVKVSASSRVEPWHPIGQPANLVMAWRERLATLGITQPFKQAHREIYVVTDAERRTGSYSNRFASHILRQQQFRALAPGRKWRAPYLGGFDGGDDGVAERNLPDGWRVEFWVNMVNEQFNPDGGSFLYIGTDQVRFYRGAADREPLPLDQVPARVFSEAMRDVDLFVGVCSVGNDPAWRDSGDGARHRNYWDSYAFGELGATALTRRDVLERLLPRLRIARVCTLKDRYLVVRGQLRTYRIHLGSGNIMMEPGNKYLCIVADRRASTSPENVFLPFEGDATLSLILSKAFLLAEDSKITDPTILSQLRK